MTVFVVNYLRTFAADPAERRPRKPRRARGLGAHDTSAISDGGETRLTEKGLSTRARIIERAAGLMFERGVHATSLADVRKASGVSGSQLSHYFTDKRDLLRHVIALRTDDVVGFHTQPPLGQLDSLHALRAWIDACMADVAAVYLRGGCVYGSLTGELLEADEGILDDLAAGYDRWIALFRNGLRLMRRRGDLTQKRGSATSRRLIGRRPSRRYPADLRNGYRRTGAGRPRGRGRLRRILRSEQRTGGRRHPTSLIARLA